MTHLLFTHVETVNNGSLSSSESTWSSSNEHLACMTFSSFVFVLVRHFSDGNQTGHFLLNFSSIGTDDRATTLRGLRFSVRSRRLKLELQSLTRHPIRLRYRARVSAVITNKSRKSISRVRQDSITILTSLSSRHRRRRRRHLLLHS